MSCFNSDLKQVKKVPNCAINQKIYPNMLLNQSQVLYSSAITKKVIFFAHLDLKLRDPRMSFNSKTLTSQLQTRDLKRKMGMSRLVTQSSRFLTAVSWR